MAFYSYLSTKIIIAFITKSYQDLFGVRSYINALFFAHSFAGKFLYITHRDNFFLRVLYFFPGVLSGFRYNLFFTFTLGHLYQINTGTNKNNRRQLRP